MKATVSTSAIIILSEVVLAATQKSRNACTSIARFISSLRAEWRKKLSSLSILSTQWTGMKMTADKRENFFEFNLQHGQVNSVSDGNIQWFKNFQLQRIMKEWCRRLTSELQWSADDKAVNYLQIKQSSFTQSMETVTVDVSPSSVRPLDVTFPASVKTQATWNETSCGETSRGRTDEGETSISHGDLVIHCGTSEVQRSINLFYGLLCRANCQSLQRNAASQPSARRRCHNNDTLRPTLCGTVYDARRIVIGEF